MGIHILARHQREDQVPGARLGVVSGISQHLRVHEPTGFQLDFGLEATTIGDY